MQLTRTEARVLGSLIEKEITTPEYYPLSLNALLAACNQKSSREPVMTISEEEARGALRSLEDAELVSVDHGSRVQRYENRARTVFQLRRDEAAVMCLLLLRGPQTPGELRSRADRLYTFDDVPAVLAALQRLSTPADSRSEPLVAVLARQPGTKESRYVHLLQPLAEQAAPAAEAPSRGAASPGALSVLQQQVAALEARVELVESALRALQESR